MRKLTILIISGMILAHAESTSAQKAFDSPSLARLSYGNGLGSDVVRRQIASTDSQSSFSSTESEMLALVNQFRAQPQVCRDKRGRIVSQHPSAPPLMLDTRLNRAARLHSEDMANNNYYSHDGLDGSSFGDRVRATGYPMGPGAENIFKGPDTLQEAIDGWIKSAGHCENMMNSSYTQLGAGFAQDLPGTRYWTQVFSTPRQQPFPE